MGGTGTVTHDDGIAESFDPDFVDPEVAEVRGGLGVVKFSRAGTGLTHRFIL